MKLQATFALSMALALPAALSAQDSRDDGIDHQRNSMGLTVAMDSTGVDLNAPDGYADGTTILLVSLTKADQGEEFPIPDALGGGAIGLGNPFFVLALDQADGEGNYHLALDLDTRALAALYVTVYVQALSVNSADWPDSAPESGPIRISDVVTVDFADGIVNLDADAAASGSAPNQGTTDGDQTCRCAEKDADGNSIDH